MFYTHLLDVILPDDDPYWIDHVGHIMFKMYNIHTETLRILLDIIICL
jgi:hypothetical protein